ncbi:MULTISPECIES: hypothetical protein [unclassified Bacillus cereus group]|uniref:hypothetical protein n=1 Tax=unclassified Bacillus cereus group TaxID=2750818 RepID=UPI001F59B6CC|nr:MULTISPECIES: hypothetical protein [unclassified Bacillus cereus group]
MKKYQKANKTNIKKKAIPADTPVVIVNNTGNGSFVYTHERLEHVISIKEATGYETVKLADLKIMSQFTKGVFTDYAILIADVLDDEFTLKDVYVYLDLMPVYEELLLMAKNEDGFDTGMFERFAVKSGVKAFNQTIMKLSKPAQHRLVQALFHAYKNRVISNTQVGYDKVTFVGSHILKMDEDIIDVLKYDTRAPSIHVNELL